MTKISIEKQYVDKIEALQYEVESRKDVIAQIIANGFKVTGDTFQKYQEEYRGFFVQFNKAKQEMLNDYGIGNNKAWNLDFAKCELTVED